MALDPSADSVLSSAVMETLALLTLASMERASMYLILVAPDARARQRIARLLEMLASLMNASTLRLVLAAFLCLAPTAAMETTARLTLAFRLPTTRSLVSMCSTRPCRDARPVDFLEVRLLVLSLVLWRLLPWPSQLLLGDVQALLHLLETLMLDSLLLLRSIRAMLSLVLQVSCPNCSFDDSRTNPTKKICGFFDEISHKCVLVVY